LATPSFAADPQFLHYQSNGRTVTIDFVEPARTGQFPAVLLLYGRGGLSFYGAAFKQLALTLAAQGFLVLTPHYFDATASADSPAVTPASFETWRQALQDALTFVSKHPDIDPRRIGVVGVSLGGFLAGVEAVQNDRIAALVSESSGFSTWFPAKPIRMPPVLIVHSREDSLIPLSDAVRLGEIARRFDIEPEFASYDGRAHILTGSAALSADQRIVAFLTKALGAATSRR
jgi:carboxymethylenebutenolidase